MVATPISLTFDVPVHNATSVHGVDCQEDVSSIVSGHLLSESLLGYGPQSSLITVLHKHVQFILQERKEKGRDCLQ